MVIREAKTLFDNIVVTRTWNASFGGVYVKEQVGIKPNPYLKNNIMFDEHNKTLIKINPAWMTRQISEISNRKNSYYFKITSLKPLNPENIADKFETKALKYFEQNRDEKYFYNFNEGFDFMGKLKVKESCLNCHREQGYKLNDIRGGIRVSLPLDSYYKEIDIIQERRYIVLIIIIAISFIGYLLLILFMKSHQRYEKHMIEFNQSLEHKVKNRTEELESLNKILKTQAITDSLTGIYNRNMFNTILVTRSEEAKHSNKALSLIMFDIDFFKKINDNYGHQVGDSVLKELTKLILIHIRKDDVFVRWGGEEFMILVNLKLETSLKVAKHLREMVEKYKFSKIDNLTCSFGVAEFKTHQSLDEFISEVDNLLYLAKRKGRNRVES